MRLMVLTLLTLFCVAHARETNPMIAVLPLQALSAQPGDAARATDQLRTALALTGKCRVVDTDKVAAVLAQYGSACVNDSCVADIGLALGIKLVVVGNLEKKQDTLAVVVRLVDVVAVKTIAVVQQQIVGDALNSFEGGMGELAKKIMAPTDTRLKQSSTPTITESVKDTSSTRMQRYAPAPPACYAQGNTTIQAGLGLLMSGPVGGSVVFEYGLHKYFSAGAGVGLSSRHVPANQNYYYNHLFIPLGARAALHILNLPVFGERVAASEKLDIYAGLAAGYVVSLYSWQQPSDMPGGREAAYDPVKSHVVINPLAGIRYYFMPEIFGYAEGGSGFGWINLGAGMLF